MIWIMGYAGCDGKRMSKKSVVVASITSELQREYNEARR